MTTGDAQVVEEAVVQPIGLTRVSAQIVFEQYYSEAGPDYAAWSPEFNMHFGYYRAGANPLRRECMLEQMNVEVLARLRLADNPELMLLDLGCGLGATLRSIARRAARALTGAHTGALAGGAHPCTKRRGRLRGTCARHPGRLRGHDSAGGQL